METIMIDTDVFIEYLRAKDKGSAALMALSGNFNMVASAITEFELYLGAKTNRHALDLQFLFSSVEVVPFDFGCGRIAAELWKKIKQSHQHAEIKDIFIGSIALKNRLRLFTFNKKHFTAMEDMGLRLFHFDDEP